MEWQIFIAIGDFIERGGTVLWVIAAVSVLLWTLILERYYFIWWVFPRQLKNWKMEWQQRDERNSWCAQRIREELISKAEVSLSSSVSTVKTLVAICPMLGLLGTVLGMIEVFDVIAMEGSNDVRGVSAGVSMATIPSMAGLVVALSGYYFSARLCHLTRIKRDQFSDELMYD